MCHTGRTPAAVRFPDENHTAFLKGVFPMRRPVFLVLLTLVLLLAAGAACADIIKDFTFTPQDHAVDVAFTAQDYDSVTVYYTNKLEKGSLKLKSDDGRFTGTISVPKTYPGNTVTVTVKSARGKDLLKKTSVTTALVEIPAVEKAAEGRLSGVTVCVDPGHQGVPIGLSEPLGPGLSGKHTSTNGQAQGTVTRRKESVVVLEIGLKLRNALLLEGADVVMTREDQNTPVTNVHRAEIANDSGAGLFIRLHCDSSSNKKKRGIHVYIPLGSTYAREVADPKTYRTYGEALFSAMCEATGVTKGSVIQNNSYVASNWAKMPAFLVEMGYMSNEEDDLLLSTDEYQDALVKGMVNGLVEAARLRGLIQ